MVQVKERKVSNKELVKARKIISKFNKQRQKTEDKKHLKEITLLNGKCFKFRNGYGDDTHWWLYKKVVGIKDDSMIIEAIQRDNSGRITIEKKKEWIPEIISKLTFISITEYENQTKKILEDLELFKK